MATFKRKRVVIVGAGFGGLSAALAFSRSPVEVLLLDRNNYHFFSPLLHQVATAELEPELIAYPIRRILRKRPNIQFIATDVKQIYLTSQFVEANNNLIPYDYLILACGSTSQFYNVGGAVDNAFSLKNLQEAVTLRNHILSCFEQATEEPDVSRRRQLLTFAVVGGGATGVEFAGSLAELIHDSLVKDYPTLDFTQVRLVLFHSGENLLPGMAKHLGLYAKKQLEKIGVEVMLQNKVKQVNEDSVYLDNQKILRTSTVVWTAGVRGHYLAQKWGLPTTKNGQVSVTSTLQLPNYPQVYVVGDLAAFEQEGKALPMLAQVAMQQGKSVANNIIRQIKGQNLLQIRYRHKGTLVILGRNAAVAEVGKLTFTGFLAWLLWLYIHAVNLLGYRNRLIVLINWFCSYFWRQRVANLIFPEVKLALRKHSNDDGREVNRRTPLE
ncbi:MAG: NAD(P)/FAD-dependent oxidoreductase [Calothrix sp. SM1_7_51]|nr:NAD(P)/FAD-dependent oxidoreductase [Calothrix sp. SM1_7_51]